MKCYGKKAVPVAIVVSLIITGLVLVSCGGPAQEIDLEAGFTSPPASAKPHTWWHWMNGNITKEGITRDLEAMAEVGIGGFQIFQVGTGIPKGPVDYGSSEHLELLEHAAAEADRLGLEFSMHNCPGWSSSGGPWITPELSMQQLVWSEIYVAGGRGINVMLPQPLSNLGYYRDAFVLAFPSLVGENQPLQDLLSRVTSSSGSVDAELLTDGDLTGGVEVSPADSGQSAFLLLEFAEPFEARSISVSSSSLPGVSQEGAPGRGGFGLALEASDDGVQFRTVSDLASTGGRGTINLPATATFPAVQAKYYRLVLPTARLISEVQISGAARIDGWLRKSNAGGGSGFGGPSGDSEQPSVAMDVPSGSIIDPGSVLDVTRYMDEQGQLSWEAPAGSWTILRLGHTSTGVVNHPAPDGGEGLEVDKYSKAAMDFHFEHFFGELLPALESLAAKGMAGSIIDSYEVGTQNWTAEFPREFKQRCGYDLWQYLPAMTGRVVGSADISDRFLWDVRRTQADMMADNYYGRFTELCNKYGLNGYAEPYSGGPFEEMQIGSRMDMVMGEFWQGRDNHRSVKLVASIAHVNGISMVGAESFTSRARWLTFPYALKALGDFMYTQGLNRYIFHTFAHQPHLTAIPSMTMGPWGWHFNHPNTWFYQSTTWLEYVTRCQFMLQQGLFVGDLAYLTSEDAPGAAPSRENLTPEVPKGYDFDIVNPEAVMTRMRVRDGQIVLPDGMSYRLMILPEGTTMTLELLSKIRDMVNQGLWLVGPKPEHSPSLAGYPASEEEVNRIADELWGNLNGTTITERAFGRGRVFWGAPLPEVLAKLNLRPDFTFTSRSAEADINYIHRRVGEIDFYFVANRGEQSEDLLCTFRVEGQQPEFWDAVSGKITPAEVYGFVDGGIRVPIQLDAAGSIFIVFRSPATEQHLDAILKDGVMITGTEPLPIREEAPEELPEEEPGQGFGRWQQAKFPMPALEEPPALELAVGEGQELLIWQNGSYSLRYSEGQTSSFNVSEIGEPVELTGPWQVNFPPNLGAPSDIRLDDLISLSEHSDDGVKYFSGTATYAKQFNVAAETIGDGKRLYLDLGQVEVLAEVLVNGQNLGILWMPPFRIDITDVIRVGTNSLEIRVTNLWPNRLIGDELMPPENEYADDGAIIELPDWYIQGQPKPAGGRITFTTWRHWTGDDLLLESGLIGPVQLRTVVQHTL